MARSPRMLTLIGSLKLAKALALLSIAITILLRGPRFGTSVRTLAEALKVDPGNHQLNAFVERCSGVSAHTLREIAFATFLYAAVYATEGVGLILQKRWAEYMTVLVTASFMPIEVYELSQRLTVVRLGALLLNGAVVAFLLWNLYRERLGDRADEVLALGAPNRLRRVARPRRPKPKRPPDELALRPAEATSRKRSEEAGRLGERIRGRSGAVSGSVL